MEPLGLRDGPEPFAGPDGRKPMDLRIRQPRPGSVQPPVVVPDHARAVRPGMGTVRTGGNDLVV